MIKDTPLQTSAAELFDAFSAAGQTYRDAQDTFHESMKRATEAKRDHDGARADLIDPAREERPQGKNAEEREAWVHMKLEAEREALYTAEDDLADARHTLEHARVAWDELRYKLRCLEIMK